MMRCGLCWSHVPPCVRRGRAGRAVTTAVVCRSVSRRSRRFAPVQRLVEERDLRSDSGRIAGAGEESRGVGLGGVGGLHDRPGASARRRARSCLTACPMVERGARPNHRTSWPEPDDHCLGRSRGEFTTKSQVVDGTGRPLTVRLTGGQAGGGWIPAVIPQRSDQIAARRNRGRSGGRRPDFDPEKCKGRNVVERCCNRF